MLRRRRKEAGHTSRATARRRRKRSCEEGGFARLSADSGSLAGLFLVRLLVELRELGVVDLDERLAAQLVHVLAEALLVELVGDALAEVVLDLVERPISGRRPLGDVEDRDGAAHE